MTSFILSIPCITVQFLQFLQKTAHICHLIDDNAFKIIKLLHVSVLTGPSSGSILIIYKS
jgi:hypothetical protein